MWIIWSKQQKSLWRTTVPEVIRPTSAKGYQISFSHCKTHNSFSILIVLIWSERWKQEGYCDNYDKTVTVFWLLFSLESLQLNKWIWHHNSAGNKLALFPSLYLRRTLASSLGLKATFTNYSWSPTLFFLLKRCFLFVQLCEFSLTFSFSFHSVSFPHHLFLLSPFILSIYYVLSIWDISNMELSHCSQITIRGQGEIINVQWIKFSSRQMHRVWPRAGTYWLWC